MSEPLVNVITPATSVGLISLEDAKLLLDIPAGDTSGDAKLQMLIDQNSMGLAGDANRWKGWGKQKVIERWDCVGPVCCPNGTCKIWLMVAPVKLADIESVESPEGTLIDPSGYRLEENTGKLILIGGCASEILITYTGGYDLPDEAPLELQQALRLRVRQEQTQEAQAATGGSGIRMLAHKDSRIMYFSPKDMAGGSTGASGGLSVSAADKAIENLISKYTRYWI
jgi:hypothetical protein